MNEIVITPACKEQGYVFEDGIFGINMEVTRRGFFGGISAQMLNNRKLLMGEAGVDGWVCEGCTRVLDRPDESLCQSHFVILKNGYLSQTSEVIALQTGKTYEAKVWVKAYSATATVTFGVSGLEQTFPVTADGAPYKALSFVFDGVDTEEGTFSVKTEGEVAVYEVSLLPTDTFYGMRWDVIECLRAIAPTSIRYPGGCYADHFEWRESLKAPEFRKPIDGRSKGFMLRDSYHQDCVEVGLNEFVMLCRELGAEPEYTVSILQSDGADARDLVEYCNGSDETSLGAVRRSLGYDAFRIKTWYVGNEVYYFGAQYRDDGVAAAVRTAEIVNAMRTVDADIRVILGVVADAHLQQWSFDFLAHLTCTFDLISHHRYMASVPEGEALAESIANLEGFFKDDTDEGLTFYKERLFKERFDEIAVCVDEWNFCWGTPSNNDMLFSNALTLHFFAHTIQKYHIREARFFMPINEGMIFVRGNACKMESTGELFRLMAAHRGGRVIPCHGESSALDILCTDHGDHLCLSVINRKDEAVRLSVAGYETTACTEIRTGTFSFTDNDYVIIVGDDGTVHGHSVLFLTARAR